MCRQLCDGTGMEIINTRMHLLHMHVIIMYVCTLHLQTGSGTFASTHKQTQPGLGVKRLTQGLSILGSQKDKCLICSSPNLLRASEGIQRKEQFEQMFSINRVTVC